MRGFGHSPLDAYMTYASLGREAENRLRYNQDYALRAGQFASSVTPDPLSMISKPGLATTLGSTLGSQGFNRSRISTQLNPYDPFTGGFHESPGDYSGANAMMALGGGLMGAAGNLGAAYIGRQQPNAYNPGMYNYGPMVGAGGQMSYPVMGNYGQAYTATY
jgi:hypothetical protein